MAKVKGKKGVTGGVNSHIRARLNYLNQAASYLQSRAISSNVLNPVTNNKYASKPTSIDPPTVQESAVPARKSDSTNAASATTGHLVQVSRTYMSHMRGVSLKTQLRQPVEVKRSVCKRCDTLLIPEVNSTEEIRNPSRARRKPWADVRVVRCSTCGTEKRFPQTDRRSKKLSERQGSKIRTKEQASAE
ncbi:RNAse P Rpr2/Rpp21/SNM1 subunit domain-containing protein [Aspergillus floccosus]